MQTIRRNAAQATCRVIGQGGILEISFYGPINLETYSFLRAELIPIAAHGVATVARMDRALFMLEDFPKTSGKIFGTDFPPTAFVVSPGDYEFWASYGRHLAQYGVMCAVFASEQSALAYRWAETHARLSPAKSPQ